MCIHVDRSKLSALSDVLVIVKSSFMIDNGKSGQRNNLKERSKFTTSQEHCALNSYLTFHLTDIIYK